MLEAYGIVTKNNVPIDTLNPKICPHCSEGNTQDAKFCAKCKMIMSYEGYQEALESEKKKEDELKIIKEQFSTMQSQLQMLISTLGNSHMGEIERNTMARNMYDSGLIKEAISTTTTSEELHQQKKQQRHVIETAGKADVLRYEKKLSFCKITKSGYAYVLLKDWGFEGHNPHGEDVDMDF